MIDKEKVEVLRKKYDLDCLDVGKNSLYIHFGRDLSMDELNQLTVEIESLQEEL